MIKIQTTILFMLIFFNIAADDKTNKTKIQKDSIHVSIEKHIRTIASKEYSGRSADHKGLKKAADYIIKEFKQSGIQPLPGTKSYLQELEVIKRIHLAKESTFSIFKTSTKVNTPLVSKSSALSYSKPTNLKNKEIVFVGYGITRKGYDDYAKIEVKDKIVLLFRYEPEETTAPYKPTDHANISSKLKLAEKNGASGVIFINAPNAKRFKNKDVFVTGRSRFFLKPTSYNIPMIQLQRTFLKTIEDQANISFSEIQTEIDKNKKPNSFLIKDLKISMNVIFKIDSFKTHNVIGYLPGNDPALAKESILIGAHYDHVGFGHFGSRLGKKGRNKLHPGADDNASGTAAIIEIAKILKKKQISLKRNVIFALFTAEEMGLLGSQFCANSNEIKKLHVKAMINFDMIGNYSDKQTLRINGIYSSKIFKPLMGKSDFSKTKHSYSLYSPEIGPSDHQSFFKQGIPSMHIFTGFSKHYHTPTDTVDVVNYDGVRKIVSIISQFVTNLSTHQGAIKLDTSHKYNPRASVRNISFNRSKGNSIKKVVKNSPEAKAGLKVDDILIEVDYIKINSFYEYYSIMRDRATGETIQFKVKRKLPVKTKKDSPVFLELEFIIKL